MSNDNYKGVKSFQEALDIASNIGTQRGPYSFSRLGACPYKFKKQYIEKAKGLEVTRFGTNIGSMMHDLAELDVQMRLLQPPEEWLPIEDMVEDSEHAAELSEMLHEFRFSFQITKEHYAGSELELGADISMEAVDYSDLDNAWFRGKIDYLEINNSAGLCRVVDYKNYPRIHSDREIGDRHKGVGAQLMGYLALVMALYPHIRAGYYEVFYFRFGTSRSSVEVDEGYIGRDEVEEWWRFNQRKMLSFERKAEFPPIASIRECQYCPFIKQCPWYQNQGEEEYIAFDERKAQDLLNRLVLIKEEEKRIKHALDNFAGEEGPIYLENGTKYGYFEVDDVKVDVKVFMEACRRQGIDPAEYVTVSPSKADKAKSLMEDKELIDEAYSIRKATRKKFK